LIKTIHFGDSLSVVDVTGEVVAGVQDHQQTHGEKADAIKTRQLVIIVPSLIFFCRQQRHAVPLGGETVQHFADDADR